MEYSHRYRAYPSDEVAAELEHQLDVHRQLYNHVRWDYTAIDFSRPTAWTAIPQPRFQRWWTD